MFFNGIVLDMVGAARSWTKVRFEVAKNTSAFQTKLNFTVAQLNKGVMDIFSSLSWAINCCLEGVTYLTGQQRMPLLKNTM